MLRHEASVLRHPVHRPALEPADRAVPDPHDCFPPASRHLLVHQSTLLRWQRDLVAKRSAYCHGRPGRPPIAQGATALLFRVAKEKGMYRCRRIDGELAPANSSPPPSDRPNTRAA